MLLTILICWVFSKQTPLFFLKATIQRKCSNVLIEVPSPFHLSSAQLSFLAEQPKECKAGTVPAQGEPGF